MWKTRFEVSGNHHGLTRHNNQSPTVPRVREDSLSAIFRLTPSSSIPNLEILREEEDEDIPSNEQSSLTSLTIRKPNSYQSLSKYQFVLPTIVESNDHESSDEKPKQENSLAATNTNYNQAKNLEIERTNKNNRMTEFTFDKRINELLQQRKSQGQNKFISSSIDENRTEIIPPMTFKDISAFFENKALTDSSTKIFEPKKIIRAKRSLLLNRQIPLNNNDLNKLEIISSTNEKEYRQIKRIKTTDKSPFDSIIKSKSSKKTYSIISLLFIIVILVYFGLTKIFKDSVRIFPQQSKETMMNRNNIISRYGQFVRDRFVSLLDLFFTHLGQLFFRIDKYEYKNNIVYIVTSTYEHLYDWFIHNLFKSKVDKI